ncbi:EVE domain-containing protein [Ferrovum sp.]|uniref:EVE domain-containing protein n=1 Tax=Ferrovum sp. TaxID=2609467 RepID=UPI0026053252|nr:EVE domain-containing protein [Ferrovum sp.]
MTTRYWVGVASREHVRLGIQGGFSQLCHGKAQPLKRMAVGDWLIYYSPKERFDEVVPCQKFTAIGQVVGEKAYPFEMSPGFIPYRRDVGFLNADDVPIRPLIDQLSFIRDKGRWGYAFRFGQLEIPKSDFEVIATSMLGYDPNHG